MKSHSGNIVFGVRWLLIVLLSLVVGRINAQSSTRIRGVVTDSATGEPIPLVNVFFPGTDVGITTNFEGEYFLDTKIEASLIKISCVGYKTKQIRVVKGSFNQLDVKLVPDIQELATVTVRPGVNPAFAVLDSISKYKRRNNPDKYDYFCKTYTRMELDATNINPYFKNKRLQRDFGFIFQYMDTSAITGKPFLPVMITEGASDYYYRSSPLMKREIVTGSKISGVKTDYTFAQFTGQLHQKANFYDNFLDLFEVRFVSPLCETGKMYYDYFLVDSVKREGRKVYTMRFHPKSYSVPTMDGELKIDSTTWALVSATASLGKKVNVNWLRHLVLRAEYDLLEEHNVWFPKRDEMFADFSIFQSDSSKLISFLGRRHIDYMEPKLNPEFPKEILKLDNDVTMPKDVLDRDSLFWDSVRPYQLSKREEDIFLMVDSVKSVPLYHSIETVLETAFFGYFETKYLGFGPYYKLFSYNGVEGARFQLGLRTTEDFSKKVRLSVYGAYGTKDNKWKGGGDILYQFNTQPFSQLRFSYKNDVDQIGAGFNALTESNILSTALSRGDNDKLTPVEHVALEYEKEWKEGFDNTFGVSYSRVKPTHKVPFITPAGDSLSCVSTLAFALKTRLAWNEIWIRSDFSRTTLSCPYPRVGLDLTYGVKGTFKNDFNYLKSVLWSQYDFYIAPLGYSDLYLSVGKIWGKVPYPLLKIHEGNGTYFYDKYAFSCMNYYEFASDVWATLMWEHHFRGFFLGKIPLLKKLKWREVVTYKVLWGTLSNKNNGAGPNSEAVLLFPAGMSKVGKPYMEFGVGIENIFRIFRVDAVWRLTHREQVQGIKHQNFALNVSVHLSF